MLNRRRDEAKINMFFLRRPFVCVCVYVCHFLSAIAPYEFGKQQHSAHWNHSLSLDVLRVSYLTNKWSYLPDMHTSITYEICFVRDTRFVFTQTSPPHAFIFKLLFLLLLWWRWYCSLYSVIVHIQIQHIFLFLLLVLRGTFSHHCLNKNVRN